MFLFFFFQRFFISRRGICSVLFLISLFFVANLLPVNFTNVILVRRMTIRVKKARVKREAKEEDTVSSFEFVGRNCRSPEK